MRSDQLDVLEALGQVPDGDTTVHLPARLLRPLVASARLVTEHGRIVGTAYEISVATEEVVHADPCDCDEDEETAGEACLALSVSYPALLHDEGAHGMSVTGFLAGPNELDVFRRWLEEQT